MLIYVNITDRRTDRQTHQKYSSEPHKIKIDTQIHTQKLKYFFLYFKLSNSKFAKELRNTQTQILKQLKTQTQT